MSTTAASTPEAIRNELLETIRQAPDETLPALRKAVLDAEIERLVAIINEEGDKARAAGRLDPAAIAESIRKFRQRHPYR